ncbi:tryptophan halogenase family protein [Colwellia sp. C1TZA3]|uniref:tryptophan halogenase family protein n=1 Tax=Colwellia sp. C1TZA3 TaxID=2508879 RepID=UPI0011B987A9|nr:tryptophan halogenase family protein [Colwellia sp. C1TZA3]TWX69061.1 tryptophan 7-halogenase [Colwellia sp. C1TZA3]
MQSMDVKNVVIVGGGTAGWMSAAGMSKLLGSKKINIRVIESESIGTVGVGEATVPHIQYFNRLLGIDENSFIKKTNATFKYGIEFVDWHKRGESYFHSFGPYGMDMEGIHFHHMWLRQQQAGTAKPIDEFNLQIQAAKAGKYMPARPELQGSPLSALSYAFQFDAVLYAAFLRDFSEKNGVTRTEGKIVNVTQAANTGHIESVTLEDGECIKGDLFIDCSGFKGLLIEETLKTGYDDWSHYLPCDSAVTRLSERMAELPPYTRATAKAAGWQWRIPLQSRTGNGYVYSSQFLSDEDAIESLNKDLDTAPISDPRQLRFKTGIRKQTWNKNVVSIGLSSGFLEPLESTSIHLIQTAIARLMTNFPDMSFNQPDIDYYNERTKAEYMQIRDFLILHYKATTRDDSPFWDYVREMDIPVSLEKRIAIYKENARLYSEDKVLFNHSSWFAVFNGQGIHPQRYHPIANILEEKEMERRMAEIHTVTQKCLSIMPSHDEFLAKLL